MEDRVQINVRISTELADKIDDRRMLLKAELGKIPTRSEVVRLALEAYLRQQEDPTG